jgi:hypothetical protein
MSTWGSGLLSSDTAVDFSDGLSLLTSRNASRYGAARAGCGRSGSRTIMREVMPEEVTAAAVLGRVR